MEVGGVNSVYDNETSVELTYRAHLFDQWLTVQPDLQYIMHPGYQYKNDFVFGMHIEIGHLFEL